MSGIGAFGACAVASACARTDLVSAAPSEHGHAGDGLGAAGAEHQAGGGEGREGHDELDPDQFAALAGYCAGVPAIAASEYEGRLARVRAQLAAAELGAVIVEAGTDLRYLGGPGWGGHCPLPRA